MDVGRGRISVLDGVVFVAFTIVAVALGSGGAPEAEGARVKRTQTDGCFRWVAGVAVYLPNFTRFTIFAPLKLCFRPARSFPKVYAAVVEGSQLIRLSIASRALLFPLFLFCIALLSCDICFFQRAT